MYGLQLEVCARTDWADHIGRSSAETKRDIGCADAGRLGSKRGFSKSPTCQ
jgi:hypothetical protein